MSPLLTAGYLLKIIITQFNRRWHDFMCPCIQLLLNSLDSFHQNHIGKKTSLKISIENTIAATGSRRVYGGPVSARSSPLLFQQRYLHFSPGGKVQGESQGWKCEQSSEVRSQIISIGFSCSACKANYSVLTRSCIDG